MLTFELRKLFIDFFRSKDHLIEPSASLVPPADDKSLLLINAGMAPLKPYFQGIKTPPSSRIASCQRCLRTNDIDEVGRTPRHLTMFEMLGNFSFGDYFKQEIILWSWEFLMEWLKIPVEKLRVSVHETDDEAYGIWEKEVGVRPDWIFKLGDKDNFWFMAETGPCGPDTEIFYDIGENLGPNQTPATGGDRWVEIWNLVFTQFDRQQDGSLVPLPKKNVDTGMGLERTSMALQGNLSVFESDSFKPIIEVFRNDTPLDIIDSGGFVKAGVNSLYVVSDHVRAVTMLIADGVYPSNEGRGYVLRRLLRRALVHMRRLGQPEGGLLKAFPMILDLLGETYPHLYARREHIENLVTVEEDNFLKTLEAGVNRLEGAIESLGDGKTLDGGVAFEMFDTYGVPLDVTMEMASARGIEVDEAGYRDAMEKARRRSREVTSELLDADQGARHAVSTTTVTLFTGYDRLNEATRVLEFNNEHGFIVLECTPFYAEKGGQVGDQGIIRTSMGNLVIRDTQLVGNTVVHRIDTEKSTVSGEIERAVVPGDPIVAVVDIDRRKAIQRAHTATHIMHSALRHVLGTHVQQAGSVVEPDRFRFDFTHFQPLTDEQTRKVEDWANERIFSELDVRTVELPYEDAVEAGAMALFGEKYDKNVRMVSVGGSESEPEGTKAQSIELCGGTHVNNTGVIGRIKIVHEESVASGVRRIEAVTGRKAYEYSQTESETLANVSLVSGFPVQHLVNGISKVTESVKVLEREKKELEKRVLSGGKGIDTEEFKSGDITGIVFPLQRIDPDAVAKVMDQRAEGNEPVVVFAVCDHGGKGTVMVRCSDSVVKRGFKAGDIVKAVSAVMGGRGGGKPSFAKGGVDVSGYTEGVAEFKKVLKDTGT